ncbi:hypothetical protein, partial [Coleofasciculus sp. LEGE 07092]|uniref:hypothetical protein n=1 Tax=Coleofasciculus sp. LEGE 07092 TaxID=2777969 RepID=UPI001D1364DD
MGGQGDSGSVKELQKINYPVGQASCLSSCCQWQALLPRTRSTDAHGKPCTSAPLLPRSPAP